MTQKETGRKKQRLILLLLAIGLIFGISFGLRYVFDYYHANAKAVEIAYKASETEDYYLFSQVENNTKAIVFYPGGKVEEIAYAPLCEELSETGYDVYLLKLPLRLAVLKPSAADAVLQNHPEVKEWTIMGHSLGGAMAANYTEKHVDQIDRLVLLGAYSASDLSSSDLQIELLYGSNDQVLKRDAFEKNRSNLPEDYTEYVIEGGNHAYFGNYGEQAGDGKASIQCEEQQQEVVDQFRQLAGLN